MYEKGDIENLPLDILEPIAAALQTTPQYLMGWQKVQKKNDVLSDIVLKLTEDDELLDMVEILSNLGFENRAAVKPVLLALKATDLGIVLRCKWPSWLSAITMVSIPVSLSLRIPAGRMRCLQRSSRFFPVST